MKKIKYILLLALFGFVVGCSSLSRNRFAEETAIIPAPGSLEKQEGQFQFSESIVCRVENDEQQKVADQFLDLLETAAGFKPQIVRDEAQADFVFQHDSTLANEAYRLKVNPNQIRIEANSESGFFYAT